MGKFNNKKNSVSSDSRQMFFNTIKDMRKMIEKNTKSYTSDTLGLGKKVKMPYNHLVGRRTAIKQRYKQQKSRAHEQNIQYDSNMQLLNSELMNRKREKDDFQRNKYKYSGIQGGRIGRENNGFLQITKKDIKRIYGQKKNNHKQGNQNFKGKKNFSFKNKNKGKKNFKRKNK